MDRDVEVLIEIIAANIDLLISDGDFDIFIYSEVCKNLNFGLDNYIDEKYLKGNHIDIKA